MHKLQRVLAHHKGPSSLQGRVVEKIVTCSSGGLSEDSHPLLRLLLMNQVSGEQGPGTAHSLARRCWSPSGELPNRSCSTT